MKNICVVTGGGTGMGLDAAKLMGKDHHIILVGRRVAKLEDAIKELKELGVEAEAYPGDVSDRASIQKLAEYAASLGKVKAVIHAAGISPHMGDAEQIFAINAIGTIIVNEEFSEVMGEDSCILNISSMSGYMLPADRIPTQLYQLAFVSPEELTKQMTGMFAQMPAEQATGMSYTISKNFVQWYTEQCACKFGPKGIRVVSISPGTFTTPMGEIEGEQAASFALSGALGRMGDPMEIAKLMAFVASDTGSYITGTDFLCDGGSIASMRVRAAQAARQG